MLQVRPLSDIHVTSPFGERDLDDDGDMETHNGVDLRAAVGTPLYAMGAGLVRAAGDGVGGSGGGLAVDIVDDDDGRYVYLHMSRIDVRGGDRVVAGQLVGLTGQSGNVRGPHLHLQWQPNFPGSRSVADIAPILDALADPPADGEGGSLLPLAVGGGLLAWWLLRKKKRR